MGRVLWTRLKSMIDALTTKDYIEDVCEEG